HDPLRQEAIAAIALQLPRQRLRSIPRESATQRIGIKRSGLDWRVIHEVLCHGSRTVGFGTSTIFVVARPPPAALPVCSTSRRCAWRIIRLSGGGIGARSVRTYRNDFSVIFWQRAYVEVLQPPELRPRELPASVHT